MNLVMAEPLTKDDIVGTWAGLRPLIAGGSVGEKTADLSRVHKVFTSPGGLDHASTGGKLTTYRRMAVGHGRRGRARRSGAAARA